MRNRGIYILPNLFTISALFAGFYAIVAALKSSYDNAAIAIFVAMIMDSLDGRIARLTQSVTSFGAELDSLSDMVAFGAAPAIVIYSWTLYSLGKFGWLASFIFIAGVALRLARFNTQINQSKRYFQGLPCPAAAAVLAGITWVGKDFGAPNQIPNIAIAIITIFLGILMVSNVRFRSFKDLNLKNNVPFAVILILVLAIVFISIDPPKVLLAIFATYALSGPIMTIWELRKKREEQKAIREKISKFKSAK
jgi:CDP-diacylglycerol---serine O-phosphatidyltransferase